eukprot:IDg16009t1
MPHDTCFKAAQYHFAETVSLKCLFVQAPALCCALENFSIIPLDKDFSTFGYRLWHHQAHPI